MLILQGCVGVPMADKHLSEFGDALKKGEVRVVPTNEQILGTWKCHSTSKSQNRNVFITIESESTNYIGRRWISMETGKFFFKDAESSDTGEMSFQKQQELSYSIFDTDDKFDIVTSMVSLNGKVIEHSSNSIGQRLSSQYLNELRDKQSVISQKAIQTLAVSHIKKLNDEDLIFTGGDAIGSDSSESSITRCKKVKQG